jgi:hypothetical protein
MSIRGVAFAITLALGLSAAAVHAEEPAAGAADEAKVEVLLDTIRAHRKAFVALNLGLSDGEASRFWPVYERYQKDWNAVGDRLAALVGEYTASYRDLSDATAAKMVEDLLVIESDRVAVRRSYLDEFAKVLPGRKLARFYQIENKMDAVIRYDLAATIPVLDEKAD